MVAKLLIWMMRVTYVEMKPLRSLYAFYVAILVGFFRMEDDIEITKQKKKKKLQRKCFFSWILLSIRYSRLVILYSSVMAKIWFAESQLNWTSVICDCCNEGWCSDGKFVANHFCFIAKCIHLSLMNNIICNIYTQWIYALGLLNRWRGLNLTNI